MISRFLLRNFSTVKRPKVFFDVSIDNQKAGRLVFEVLFFSIFITVILRHRPQNC